MEAMPVMVIHLENADGEAVWWAESPQAPGFTAAAETLRELRALAYPALREFVGAGEIVERLSSGDGDSTVGAEVDSDVSDHPDVRTVSQLVAAC